MGTMIMVDFAVKDKRSVSAMLRGKGDGRENAFTKFQESLLTTPVLTESDIADMYQAEAKAQYFRDKGKVDSVKNTWRL